MHVRVDRGGRTSSGWRVWIHVLLTTAILEAFPGEGRCDTECVSVCLCVVHACAGGEGVIGIFFLMGGEGKWVEKGDTSHYLLLLLFVLDFL